MSLFFNDQCKSITPIRTNVHEQINEFLINTKKNFEKLHAQIFIVLEHI